MNRKNFGALVAIALLSLAPVHAISAPTNANSANNITVSADNDPPCNLIRVLCPHK